MTKTLSLEEFMKHEGVILDVRSPSEYEHGRIPNALSLPLFTDSERAEVGTIYKERGSEHAISLGLQVVAPKVSGFITQAKQLLMGESAKIHCWRGGMRSASMAMLLQNMGISAVTLHGGYKSYRRWTLEVFERPYKYYVLGGMTGCGKTAILHALKDLGEQVIDLERLANHRGSVFGNIGFTKQPSTEQFHNDIAIELSTFDLKRPVWIENESRQIGSTHVPETLFEKMQKAPLVVIERPQKERVEILCKEYGCADPQELVAATQRIEKKLGGVRAKEISTYIRAGNLRPAIDLVLQYYDSAYSHGLSKRNQAVHTLSAKGLSSCQWAELMMPVVEVLDLP